MHLFLCYNLYGDDMENNKNFNLFVFLSTFARNLIEAFIGSILYKAGFSLKEVILYYLIVNIVSALTTPIFIKISKKYSNRVVAFLGIIAFAILQVLLNEVKLNFGYLVLVASLFALYRRGYWIARRYYNMKVIPKKNIATSYSIISIINQLSVILATYGGALLLDFISIKVLTIISISLFIISIYPLFKLKFDNEYNNEKLDLVKTMKSIGFSNLYIFSSYELLNVTKFLFPLYVFIYVKNTYNTIGLLSLIANVATMLFSYLYARFINKEKNYLKICTILIAVVYIFKINTFGILLAAFSFLDGLITKMFEISLNKNFYELSKKFEYYNYNYAYEFAQNTFRAIIVAILYLITNDLKVMIYITLFFILSGLLFNFEKNNNKDYKAKK